MLISERTKLAMASRVFRAACALYPHELTECFGDEMQFDFEEGCREALASGGSRSVARELRRALGDIALNLGPAWWSALTSDIGQRAAFAFMLVVMPGLVLIRQLASPVGTGDAWNHRAALAMHCLVAGLFAIAAKRHARGALALAALTLVALAAASTRGVGSFQAAAIEELQLSVPVAVVLMLVHFAPIGREQSVVERS
jgi:hypothetical protein